jgi:hypothetical protein
MIPAELSQLALAAFHKFMNGKWHSTAEGNPWYFLPDLQNATDAVCEVTMRWLQEKMDGTMDHACNGGNNCGCRCGG